MIIGTCGHELKTVEGNVLRIKDTTIDYMEDTFSNCVAIVSVCDRCKKIYEKMKMVLHNEQEEKQWLSK